MLEHTVVSFVQEKNNTLVVLGLRLVKIQGIPLDMLQLDTVEGTLVEEQLALPLESVDIQMDKFVENKVLDKH